MLVWLLCRQSDHNHLINAILFFVMIHTSTKNDGSTLPAAQLVIFLSNDPSGITLSRHRDRFSKLFVPGTTRIAIHDHHQPCCPIWLPVTCHRRHAAVYLLYLISIFILILFSIYSLLYILLQKTRSRFRVLQFYFIFCQWTAIAEPRTRDLTLTEQVFLTVKRTQNQGIIELCNKRVYSGSISATPV